MGTRTASSAVADASPRGPGRTQSTRSSRSSRAPAPSFPPSSSASAAPAAPAPATPTGTGANYTQSHTRQLSHSHSHSQSRSQSQSQAYASRSQSHSHSHSRSGSNAANSHLPPHHNHHQRTTSSSRSHQSQPVPQNDYESSRLAASANHQRSSSKERPPPARGPDPSRAHRRSSSRSKNNHHSPHPEMPPSANPPSNGAGNGTASQQHGHADAPPRTSTSKHARSRTVIPTQSGKWMLGKTIGAGSMGKVKLARKEDGSEQVACKIIPRGSTDDGHQSRADKERADQSKEIRTAREAAISTLLNHPHICALHDVVRTNHHWYMLFEYVNGGQMLDYIISHGKLKEKQARKFSRQIASALDYLHRNSIVHRDLKIENILISKTGDIKIIDFGLSNLFAPRGHLKTFCGSLYFAAPELLQARAYTGPEVDVWSFGIVLYVLVCGKVPFDDQSMPALHAKIKRGLVDYPAWLSSECKHLLSRMLVTDPKQRATMQEVMTHPWMAKGFNGPPDNYLPVREPLTTPLEPEVILAMQGFNFGTPESINAQLTKIIESEEYQRAVKLYQREKELPPPAKDAEKRRPFGFDFYKRRNSGNSRDTLSAPSSEALQIGNDPMNAFSPLVSIYYLVKEKQDRDHADMVPPAAAQTQPMPEIAAPQAAHTNSAAYEMPGEKPTGGRSRPRARTHGEDDMPEVPKPPPAPPAEPRVEQLQKKEGTAAGILRRFSTRKRRDPERLDKDRSHPPVVQVHSPAEPSPLAPRKSFSIRRGRRDREDASDSQIRSASGQQHGELLSPPMSAGGSRENRRGGGLGRSTSVNSADLRRRKDPPATSGSDQSVANEDASSTHRAHGHSRSVSLRAKSIGHARRESIQQRRMRREAAQEANVPEETDQELEQSGVSTDRLDDTELAKPVFLKGLFSVSTTSGKSVPAIRTDIKRVLRQLNVEYTEIKGGFNCRHSPSIDLNKVQDPPTSPGMTPGHKRRFSFGGLMRGDDRERERDEFRDSERPPTTPRTPGRSDRDRSFSNSETSFDSIPGKNGGPSRRIPGETSTQVQSDLGGSMVLEFEIFIVKVPLLSLHGIQFKRLTGNTWQYKSMADHILRELRL
ncbi:Protein kinase kin1 [Fusarium oxysporum f. sp. cubense race 1]|uniref:non-specific serine/threonine protein kinase n=1 Tax=Fusarium oxysporum f. sp. cubense (strain race 1) TaxID=1229664 RepID=N4ULD3_FUSC1|nr:Protein kinase kin1 [Fusarium oxysporum f. sp. cubense race 1]